MFVRYNDYFYLFLRLTVIGIFVNYVIPTSGWIFTLLILFATGYNWESPLLLFCFLLLPVGMKEVLY
ncbi:hypothetical protein [Alkalihalobacterium chitinilyticum]|uniref:hypothetical protein n=1 Tax=Alkalihalobacterium chitinilyticum TaxID=2980103 RepID=UPI003571470A